MGAGRALSARPGVSRRCVRAGLAVVSCSSSTLSRRTAGHNPAPAWLVPRRTATRGRRGVNARCGQNSPIGGQAGAPGRRRRLELVQPRLGTSLLPSSTTPASTAMCARRSAAVSSPLMGNTVGEPGPAITQRSASHAGLASMSCRGVHGCRALTTPAVGAILPGGTARNSRSALSPGTRRGRQLDRWRPHSALFGREQGRAGRWTPDPPSRPG